VVQAGRERERAALGEPGQHDAFRRHAAFGFPRDELRRAVGSGERWRFKIEYILQDSPAGLAHAVQTSQLFLGESPFVMYLGDILIGSGIEAFVRKFQNSSPDAVIGLKAVDDPSQFGVAQISDAGRILRLLEKPKEPPSNLALIGVYVFSPKIHKAIEGLSPSPRGELEITDAIQRLIDWGLPVQSSIVDAWWLDTGKKDDLLAANAVVLDEWLKTDNQGEVDSFSQVAGRVKIGRGSAIINSKIRGPVIIGEGVLIEGSFVGPYSSIGDSTRIMHSVVEHCVIFENCTITGIDRLEDSVLGRSTTVSANNGSHKAFRLLLGDHSTVDL
jgi:glucose-1-phosphate thymidylyltransferase